MFANMAGMKLAGVHGYEYVLPGPSYKLAVRYCMAQGGRNRVRVAFILMGLGEMATWTAIKRVKCTHVYKAVSRRV